LPVVAVTQVGYIVAFVVVSFVIPVFTVFVASVAVVALPDKVHTKLVAVKEFVVAL
jgi:hypothetical protein